jgi:hypothetical protein
MCPLSLFSFICPAFPSSVLSSFFLKNHRQHHHSNRHWNAIQPPSLTPSPPARLLPSPFSYVSGAPTLVSFIVLMWFEVQIRKKEKEKSKALCDSTAVCVLVYNVFATCISFFLLINGEDDGNNGKTTISVATDARPNPLSLQRLLLQCVPSLCFLLSVQLSHPPFYLLFFQRITASITTLIVTETRSNPPLLHLLLRRASFPLLSPLCLVLPPLFLSLFWCDLRCK